MMPRAGNEQSVPWKCQCGAALGAVVRDADKQRRLKVFTPATRNMEVLGMRIETSVVELVGAGKVKCVFCGRVRSWHAAEEMTSEFVRRQEARKGEDGGK